MRKLQRAAIACATLVGCGGPPSGGATHPVGPSGSATQVASDPPAPQPSIEDCRRLFAHVVALRVAEQGATPPPTADEIAALQRELEAELGAACTAGRRETLACGLAAASSEAVAACP